MKTRGSGWGGGALLSAGAVGGGLALWSAIAARSAEAAVPPDGGFVEAGGARIHYTDEGSGPPIVLVHGLMGQLRNFSYALTDLLVPHHRVIAIDRPGWGYSTFTGKRPGIEQQAAIVAAFVERLELERPLLVGHSMGGAVALAAGLDAPERFSGLALIAPLAQPMHRAPPQFLGLLAPPGLRELVSWTVAVPATTITGAAVAKAIFAPDPVPGDFPVRGGGLLSMRPQSYRAGSFELEHAAGAMAPLAARYGELRLPVSILFGREDAVLDPEHHGRTTAAALADARLSLIEGGHMLPVTHPAATAAFVREAHARRLPAQG